MFFRDQLPLTNILLFSIYAQLVLRTVINIFFGPLGVKGAVFSTLHGGSSMQQGTKNLSSGQNIKILEPVFSVPGVQMPTAEHGKDNIFDASEFSVPPLFCFFAN